MNHLEILAPAGSLESIYPAVRMGANAVYIGAWKMSARSSAQNFNKEELKTAVEYCHARGVKVYLACNTLVHDDEFRTAWDIIRYACELPVDALIMQDIGLISLVRKYAPDMRIHGSTQMSVHTSMGVQYLEKMGLKRVVLSRELSENEIREIKDKTNAELEIFVHGALCMSVSGQCYFSAMLGSRSGNRGACAQPCRLPFSDGFRNNYALSLKDNSIIEHLHELSEMGITSAKIEGRMKRPEYVGIAVKACRESLDKGTIDKDIYGKLQAVFSRSGFTDGYFTGKLGADMFGIRSKENVTSATEKILSDIRTMYKDEKPLVPVEMDFRMKNGENISLKVHDNDGNEVSISGAVPEKALKVALSEEKCRTNLTKTGGTPFFENSFHADIQDGLTVPMSEINALRRNALEQLIEKRTQRNPVNCLEPTFPLTNSRKNKSPKYFRGRFVNSDIPDSFLDSELIYVPMNLTDEEYNSLMDKGFAVAVEIPRGMFGIENKIFEKLKHIQTLGINEVLASNIGAVEMAKNLDMDIHGGFGLNITNTASVEWAEKEGLLDIEVSIELTLEQIAKLGGKIPLGIVSYGLMPLMLTRNNPAPKTNFIRDRKGIDFPVQTYGACTEVLNSVPVILSDRKNELKGIDFEVYRFSVENSVEIGENSILFHKNTLGKGNFTRGLYYRGVI